MNTSEMEQEILLIKEMIEKTRRTTAESGMLLIAIGLISALATITMVLLDHFQQSQFDLPLLITVTLVNALIGYRIAAKERRQGDVKSFIKSLFWFTMMICGFAALLIVFVFPFLDLYTLMAVPTLVSVIMGIALFITGTLFELKYMQWSCLTWWAGAVLLALTTDIVKGAIMVAIILLGWVLPGMLLHKQYKNRSTR
jgi:hypothetical protein